MKFRISEQIELVIEKVLVQLDVPLMLSCRDKENNLYIALCVEEEEEYTRYLVVRSSNTKLAQMLSDKITMRELFSDKEYPIAWFCDLSVDGQLKNVVSYDGKIKDAYLPLENEYFENENEDLFKYVEKLENCDCVSFNFLVDYEFKEELYKNYYDQIASIKNWEKYDTIFKFTENMYKNEISELFCKLEDEEINSLISTINKNINLHNNCIGKFVKRTTELTKVAYMAS
ncbi:hypothetical protein [Aminipila terrae]|uniref:Uncharacterized protein n=1 Tax=Aminipila terrae TaxID=2697030 RepID=A0A6P1MMC3_9FIRM|nr:hypothetical protein [Aminipila terrae]QHI73814.1 hypothetical protein Ami3637_16755 [Aminipila terrae]